jgi:DNA-binding MarR family transcriptional regulator
MYREEDDEEAEEGDEASDLPDEFRRKGRVPDSVKENLLEHPHRADIVGLLDERPGMNKNQICNELGMDGTVLDHHLDKLENEGQLVVTRDSAQEKEVLCFLAEDAELWEDENTRILFGRQPKRLVALYLAENRGATTREIAEELRLSAWTVRHHIRTLIQHELVLRYPSGQTNVYEPADVLERWVEELGEGFERPWER